MQTSSHFTAGIWTVTGFGVCGGSGGRESIFHRKPRQLYKCCILPKADTRVRSLNVSQSPVVASSAPNPWQHWECRALGSRGQGKNVRLLLNHCLAEDLRPGLTPPLPPFFFILLCFVFWFALSHHEVSFCCCFCYTLPTTMLCLISGLRAIWSTNHGPKPQKPWAKLTFPLFKLIYLRYLLQSQIST